MAKKQQQEFAVIGLGRFGSSLACALEENGQTVMAIDIDPQLVQSIADEVTHAATLDATNEDALRAIDITAFDTVIVAIGADFEANLITTATLKDLGVRRIICKTQSNRQKEILLPASLNWQSLAQTDLRNKYQLTVLLIKRGDEVLISPTSDTVLQEGDLLIVFGDNPSITQFSKLP